MDTQTKQIPIFKVGRHTDMSGTTLEITEADLEKTVAAYQPARHEAPLVAGHPRHDSPAWGWVDALHLSEGTLQATLRQVDPAFAKLVAAGRYKKISASFYTPNAPNNPHPGVYYLRHVGFLGAQPPAIKGLPDVAFQENEQGVVVVEILDFSQPVETLKTKDDNPKHPTSIIKKESTMPENNNQTVDLAEAEKVAEESLAARELQFAEREQRLQEKERLLSHNQTVDFVEGLIQQGRLLPRHKEGLVSFIASLDENESISFSEPGQNKTTASDYLRRFLNDLPIQVAYGEQSADSFLQGVTTPFAIPDGYEVDTAGLVVHQKILTYAKTNNIDYVTAALAVGGQ